MIELEPDNGCSHSLPSKQQTLQIAEQLIVVVMRELAVDPHDRNHGPAAILQCFPIYGYRLQVAAFAEYAASTRQARTRSADWVTAAWTAGVHLRCQM
jgi:hypothetical protein